MNNAALSTAPNEVMKITLKRCISEIRKRHDQLFRCDSIALDRAMVLGGWLDKARQCVRSENRNWTEFIASTFNGNPSYDTCQRYLDLYRYSADLRSAEIKLLTDAYEFVKCRKQEAKDKTTAPAPNPPPAVSSNPNQDAGGVDLSKVKFGHGIRASHIHPRYHDQIKAELAGGPVPATVQTTVVPNVAPNSIIQPAKVGGASLYCCDMLDAPVEDNSLDAVICDPPYIKDALVVWKKLASFSAAKLKPGGVMLAMAGTYHLPSVLENLRCEGLHYYWTMCYEMEKGSDCNWSGNGRQVHTYWKPVLWYVKGGYEGKYLKCDKYADQLFTRSLGKFFHKWGQSLPFFQHLVEHFTQENQLVCDPCIGGGTTAIASLVLKRRFVGIDNDAHSITTTSERIRAWEVESVSVVPSEQANTALTE